MTKEVRIVLSNKVFYMLILIGVFLSLSWIVLAFGTSNPGNFGHTSGEIENLSWNKLVDIPAGFNDSVDDVGAGFSINYGDCTTIGGDMAGVGEQKSWDCPSGYVVVGLTEKNNPGSNAILDWVSLKCCRAN